MKVIVSIEPSRSACLTLTIASEPAIARQASEWLSLHAHSRYVSSWSARTYWAAADLSPFDKVDPRTAGALYLSTAPAVPVWPDASGRSLTIKTPATLERFSARPIDRT